MMDHNGSNAEKSLVLCSLFESEVFVWLLLRNWQHPFSEDLHFRVALLESATEILMAANETGQIFVEGLPSKDMNFIAALWYAENCALSDPESMANSEQYTQRATWLSCLKHALPSCFCPQDNLIE